MLVQRVGFARGLLNASFGVVFVLAACGVSRAPQATARCPTRPAARARHGWRDSERRCWWRRGRRQCRTRGAASGRGSHWGLPRIHGRRTRGAGHARRRRRKTGTPASSLRASLAPTRSARTRAPPIRISTCARTIRIGVGGWLKSPAVSSAADGYPRVHELDAADCSCPVRWIVASPWGPFSPMNRRLTPCSPTSWAK